MKKYFLIISLLLCLQTLIAQTNNLYNPCGTEEIDSTEFEQLPWFDNNPFLENFLDSIGYPAANNNANRIVGAPSVRFWIPIKFWVYAGTNIPNQRDIRTMLDKLNDLYNVQNDTKIGFYLKCEPATINLTSNGITFLQAVNLMTTFNEKGCINVHVVSDLTYAEGMAMKPLSINACIINARTYLRDRSTLAHEIGHVLGLIHTHIWWDVQYPCFRECVSRTRTWGLNAYFCGINRIRSRYVCESTGDALGDTQADPQLSLNNSCDYIPQIGIFENDLWGDSHANPPNGPQERPNTSNIMSYNGRDECVTQFSRLQIGVMLYNILLKKNILDALGWSNSASTFDSFEPDNSSVTGRQIFAGEIQERNFHQQYNRNLLQPFFTQCDVDWVRFVPNCNSNLSVTTSAITGKTNANTRITLFDGSLLQLTQNDNISATNLFSSLNWSFVAGQTYFIRVENMQSLVTSYYNLLIGSPNSSNINGDDAFCNTSNIFTVPNLTVGSAIQWSALPVGIVSINSPNALQTTLTKNSDGVITLTATITPTCGIPYTITKKDIIVGKGAPFTNMTLLNATCVYTSTLSSYFYGVCKEIPGAISYVWYAKDMTNNLNPYKLKGYDYSTDFPLKPGNRLYNIKVLVTTPCGTLERIEQVFAPLCVSTARIQLNPNPVTNTLNLAVIENKEILDNEIQEVIISDKIGNKVLQKKFAVGTKMVSLQINNLKPDIYFLKTWNGKTWETIQFIKK